VRRRKSSVRSYFTLGPAAVVRLCATVALLGSVGLAAAAAGPDVGIVELLLVRADSTSSVTFESGHYRVEGDVYVTAVLENRGDVAAEAYVVDFFYKEAITERTGRIGSGPVEGYGIAPTQERGRTFSRTGSIRSRRQ
jgi:hypothetical protein